MELSIGKRAKITCAMRLSWVSYGFALVWIVFG